MPALTAEQTNSLLAAVAGFAAAAVETVKTARDERTRLAAPADAESVEKAAQALVRDGWIEANLLGHAKATLADPTAALETLVGMSEKAAAALSRGGLDPRLAIGAAVPTGAPGTAGSKTAGDNRFAGSPWAPSNAEAIFDARINAFRKQTAG